MRVVVADDEPIARRKLAGLLAGLPGVRLAGVAADGVEAGELVRQLRPDVVILDVEMPGASGLDLARRLAGPDRPQVIFATAFGRYGPGAFEVAATDYLLKPVTVERLAQALRRAERRRREEGLLAQALGAGPAPGAWRDEVWVPVKGGQVRLAAEDIVWIEGASDYVILHTAARSHLLRAALTGLEAAFNPQVVRRVHRSAMVNLTAVQQVRRRRREFTLILPDDSEVPVGPSYAQEVTAALGL
jgi:two-component system, LytTR family, response regulator